MLKNKKNIYLVPLKYLKRLALFCFCVIFIKLCSLMYFRSLSYTFFIEFNDANSLKIGTPLRFRGINIGSIQSIKLKSDCVLILAKVNSSNIIMSKNSIIEITQTGLLNESIIDIIPFENFDNVNNLYNNPLSKLCDTSNIICNSMYLKGDRGLNYDDLIRSTTRISQRFDDPRFFNLFYLFLQNGIEVTDAFLELFISISEILLVNNRYLKNFILNDLL